MEHNKDISEKLSKPSKSKKRKADKKHKKHKKEKIFILSSSNEHSNDTELQWMGKKDEKQTVNSKTLKNQLDRHEKTKEINYIPCITKNIRKEKSDIKEKDKTKSDLSKSGQKTKELNLYWKDGSDELSKTILEIFNKPQINADWLKKDLRRKQKDFRDDRSLKKIAAEDLSSLETIQSMITERVSSAKEDKSHNRYYNDKNNRGKIFSRRESRSRSRSRSRSKSKFKSSKECIEKDSTSIYSSHCIEQKQIYQTPKDNDNSYQQNRYRSSSNIKKWKKNKDNETTCEQEKFKSELKEMDIQKSSNICEMSISLTETDMNKLGAKIIKAELMGDNELAVQLKIQLEHVRKLAEANSNIQEEITKDITRPLQSRYQISHKKKKTLETHISDGKVRYFTDDNYLLQEIFEREKKNSTNENEATFQIKLASKEIDYMDAMSEQQKAQTSSKVKQDKWYLAHAMKEYENLSKSIDNCQWCPDSKNMLKHMIISMDSMICLSLPAYTSLTTGHCILTSIQHVACQLQLSENVWERLKELKQKLTEMFINEDLYPIFFEIYKKRHKFSHMQLECIPVSKEIGYLAPMYFKKALLECETEWSLNRKLIDLKFKNIRHSVPNGLSYFMVEFASHSGYAHIIEDEKMFPKNFAQEIIGGMLDLDCNVWRISKRQSFDEQRIKVLEFTELWKKYYNEQSYM